MSGQVTKEAVLKVATLSALELNETEIEAVQKKLAAVVEYVGQLAHLDTKDVEEFHVIDRAEMFREDEVKQELTREEVLANAPEQGRDSFKIPKIL